MSTLDGLPALTHRAFVGTVSGFDAPDRGGPEKAPVVGAAFRYSHKTADSDVADPVTASKPYSDGQVSIYYAADDYQIEAAIQAEVGQGLRPAPVAGLTGYAVAKSGSVVFKVVTFAAPA